MNTKRILFFISMVLFMSYAMADVDWTSKTGQRLLKEIERIKHGKANDNSKGKSDIEMRLAPLLSHFSFRQFDHNLRAENMRKVQSLG